MLEIMKIVLTLSLLIIGGITLVMGKGLVLALIGIIMFGAGVVTCLLWL